MNNDDTNNETTARPLHYFGASGYVVPPTAREIREAEAEAAYEAYIDNLGNC